MKTNFNTFMWRRVFLLSVALMFVMLVVSCMESLHHKHNDAGHTDDIDDILDGSEPLPPLHCSSVPGVERKWQGTSSWNEIMRASVTDYYLADPPLQIVDVDGQMAIAFLGRNHFGNERIKMNIPEPHDFWRKPVAPIVEGAESVLIQWDGSVLIEDHKGHLHFGVYDFKENEWLPQNAPNHPFQGVRFPRFVVSEDGLSTYVAFLDSSVQRIRLQELDRNGNWRELGLMSTGPADLLALAKRPNCSIPRSSTRRNSSGRKSRCSRQLPRFAG